MTLPVINPKRKTLDRLIILSATLGFINLIGYAFSSI